VLLATACPDDDAAEPAEPFAEEPELGTGAEPEFLPEEDDELLGEEITVTGTVIRIVSPSSFLLDRTDLEGERPVMVLTLYQDADFDVGDEATTGDEVVLDIGDRVEATGTLHRLFADTFQQRFGITYDHSVFGFHQGELVIEAESLEVVERAAEGERRTPEAPAEDS
jgi:hypothetical protein